MMDDIAVPLVLVVVIVVWAFHVHEDRQNAHEIERLIVAECADTENPRRCVEQIREAL